jgi:beta-glucosidase
MKIFIDALAKKMTVDEKIGQLNSPGSGDIVTGQAGNSDVGKKIEGK